MFALAPLVAFAPMLPPACMDLDVVVFRHHPFQLTDTKEQAAARGRDEKTILKALKGTELRILYEGGLGHRGYMLHMRVRDLGTWMKVVAELRKAKSLEFYTEWQKDPKGFGLLYYGP